MRRAFVLVGLPLLIGGAIYALLRPSEVWFVAKLGGIGALRNVTVPIGRHVPGVVLDVAPDFAWAFALGALLAIVWRKQPRRITMVWFAIGAIGCIGYELAQRWHLVSGTFDPLDLVAQALGYGGGWWLGFLESRELRTTSST